MAVWLVRLLDGRDPPALSESRFEDVGSEWWSAHVDRLNDLGVTAGCAKSPPQYCPEEPVTRAQMATFLVRAFGLEPAGHFGFTDIGGTHEGNINALAAAGITAGCEAFRYCPDEPVKRAQMATFLVRAIENRPMPGVGSPIADMLPIPVGLAADASIVATTGRLELPVYICGDREKFDGADVRREVQKLNERIASFYREQSSSTVDLVFTWGGIVSPYEYWSHLSVDTLYAEIQLDEAINPDRLDACSRASKDAEGHRQVVVLADVRKGSVIAGYAWRGLGPALQPLEVRFSNNEDSYLQIVAHEVGHSRFGFCHEHENYGTSKEDKMKCGIWAEHDANVYDPNGTSIMSYSRPKAFRDNFVACTHKEQAGWPLDSDCNDEPVLPGPVRSLRVTGRSESSVTFEWDPPSTGTGPFTYYLDGVEDRNWSSTSVTVTGLSCGREKTLGVSAVNSAGTGPKISDTGRTEDCNDEPVLPGPVRSLRVTGRSESSVTFEWDPPSTGTGPFTYYLDGVEDRNWSSTSVTVTGLSCGREKTLGVSAVNSAGTGPKISDTGRTEDCNDGRYQLTDWTPICTDRDISDSCFWDYWADGDDGIYHHTMAIDEDQPLDNTFEWQFDSVPQRDNYEIRVRIPPQDQVKNPPYATTVTYYVRDSRGTEWYFTVDQRAASSAGGGWITVARNWDLQGTVVITVYDNRGNRPTHHNLPDDQKHRARYAADAIRLYSPG